MNHNKVLIVSNHVTSLNIIRSLGSKGIPVYLTHKDPLSIARYSKHCKKFYKSPSFFNSREFVDFLISLAKNEGLEGAILIPTNDHTVSILSQNKVELEKYFKVPLPGWKIINRAFDKRLTFDIAMKNGIPVPKPIYPKNLEDLRNKINELTFPVVIKPAFGKDYYFAAGTKMHMANNVEETELYYNKIATVLGVENVIIQEYIPGEMDRLYNYATVMKKGEAYGIFTGKKIRQHPRDFGVGTAAQVVNDQELRRLGTLLLKSCEYEGIGYIEFKKDPRDEKYKLIEINARLWNFMDLAMANGVDLPYILYKYALDQDLPKGFTEGDMKWLHWWTDFGVTFKEVLKGNENFKDYFKSLKGEKKYAVLSLNDPLPFIMETLFLPYLLLTR